LSINDKDCDAATPRENKPGLGRRRGGAANPTKFAGNGTQGSYSHLASGTSTDSYRLRTFKHDLAGSAADVAYDFAYNQVGEITASVRDNDSYAWANHVNTVKSYDAANGLNQYPKITVGKAAATPTYDGTKQLSDSLRLTP
jgi:hypothetical protein